MNVSLTPELERYIKRKIDSQLYQTASEVVRDALRLLRQRDQRLAELRREIQVGIDDVENGRVIKSKDLTVEKIRARAIARYGAPGKGKRK